MFDREKEKERASVNEKEFGGKTIAIMTDKTLFEPSTFVCLFALKKQKHHFLQLCNSFFPFPPTKFSFSSYFSKI